MTGIRILSATVSDCESEHNLFDAEHTDDRTFGEMSSQGFDELRESVKVRYSRRLARSSVLAIAAARRCLEGHDVEPERLGVITTGGPLHLCNAWGLTSTVLFEDADLVDPLRFPQSIVSSIPCSVAAAVNAHAFAFAIGYNATAFCEALNSSVRLLTNGFAGSVVLVAAMDTDTIVKNCAENAGSNDTYSGAIAFLLTIKELDRHHGKAQDTNGSDDLIEYAFAHKSWLGREPLLAAQCGFELHNALSDARLRLGAKTFRVRWTFGRHEMQVSLKWHERCEYEISEIEMKSCLETQIP